jgi:glycosyltransferase involved in cell wall biosynthesis
MPIPSSDGTVEKLEADLVHFVLPQAYITAVPSIYQVHDLLHLAFPDLFSKVHRQYREVAYATFARQAHLVVTMTEWGRQQIADGLGIEASRIAVVPWAPVIGQVPTAAGEAGAAIGSLPDRYLLYPAQTWAHKNHLGLIDALAILRGRGHTPTVVLTGRETPEFAKARRRMDTLKLHGQVRVLGRVPDSTLIQLYQNATAIVFPSRYEGWGLPIVEAFAFGVPVAASNTTAIPEVAGGAALLFDPEDPGAIADAIERIVDDAALRSDLRARGLARAAALTWHSTADRFRALYRLVGGRTLTTHDLELLQPPVTRI